MVSKWNKIACIIITNPSRDIFYLQQKDETYYSKENRLKYALFGGGIEDNENEKEAILRELDEELDEKVAEFIKEKIKHVFTFDYFQKERLKEKLFVFEAILPDKTLEKILKFEIKEGKRAVIILKKDLNNLDLIDISREIFDYYFTNIIKN